MLIPPSLCIKAKGWDEQKQEWVFKEFMSPEFTYEGVVGREDDCC